MHIRNRAKRLEEQIDLENEEHILAITIVAGREIPDLPDFPYEHCKDCKNYQRQLREQREKEPEKRFRIIDLCCKDCTEDCPYKGMSIGTGQN